MDTVKKFRCCLYSLLKKFRALNFRGLGQQQKNLTTKISRSTVYLSAVYTAAVCYHDCTELKKNSIFYISGQYCAEVADTAVCTPDFAVLPSALSGSPH